MNKLTDLQKELTALIALVVSVCPALTSRFLRMKGLTDITVCYHDKSDYEIFRVIKSLQVNGIKDRIDMLYLLHKSLIECRVCKIVLTFDQSRGNMINTYYLE